MHSLSELEEDLRKKELELQTLNVRVMATRGYMANLRKRIAEEKARIKSAGKRAAS